MGTNLSGIGHLPVLKFGYFTSCYFSQNKFFFTVPFSVQPLTANSPAGKEFVLGEKQHAVYLETSVVMGIVIFVKRQTKVIMGVSMPVSNEYF